MSAKKFYVGQVLWYVPFKGYGRGSPGEVTVKSVGRKWVTLSDNDRFDANTMLVDGRGYSSPGRLWLSKEEQEAHADLHNAWRAMRKHFDGLSYAPEGVTLNDIQQARKLLRIDQ